MDIAIYRAVRQDNQQHFYYGYTHAIHTAMLSVLLSRRMGWPAPRLMSLLKAALTMNITILELQGHMAFTDVPVKDAQRAEIGAHPAKAVALLTALGVTDADWLAAIAQHHEHLEGTGYPSGTREVSELAVVLRVADVLMAKISPRRRLLAQSATRPCSSVCRQSVCSGCPAHCPPEAVSGGLQPAHTDQPDLCEPAVPHGDHQMAFNGKHNLSWILETHPWVNDF